MTHMDDRNVSSRTRKYRKAIGMLGLAVLVIGGAVALKTVSPTNEAQAQFPRRQKRTKAPVAQPPKATQAQTAVARSNSNTVAPVGPKAASPNGTDIAAVVNGEIISRQSLGNECAKRWGEETLESLVNKHLITQACRSRGIIISDPDIENEINRIATKFGLTADHWLKMLKSERNVSAAQYRRDIIWPTLALKKLAADKLTITDEQLKREYESEYGPKVQVRMISLTSAAKAKEVLALAKASPDDFARLAKDQSEDPTSASAMGLIPPVRKHMGEPAVESAVFALQPGEVSEVVHAANQYLIFKCEKHVPAGNISGQFRQQAIDRLKERILERNLRDASGTIFEELQSQAKVVNVLNDPARRKQSPGVAALVNSTPITMKQLIDECVVRYGRDMVETEINYRLLQQALKAQNLSVSQEEISKEVARAAESFGYLNKDGSVNVDEWIKEVTKQEGIGVKEYIRDAVWPSVALKQLVSNEINVTGEDLEKGFEANYGERVEVLAIVLGNMRLATEVWEMARDNDSREFFGQLAEQYSIESVSRANYGEIPPIRHYGGQPQIENAAFKLKPNELSGIIAMGDKFIILKCLGRTEPYVENLADVKDELEKDIREKKLRVAMADEFERLRSVAKIDNFLAGRSQLGSQSKPRVPARPVSSKSVSGGNAGPRVGTPLQIGPRR